METSKRFKFNWITGSLFKPGRTFAEIAGQPSSSLSAPLLILTLTGLLVVFLSGWIQQKTVTDVPLPPGYEYMTPEQQAQYNQAAQLRQGPVFRYVFPGIKAIFQVWAGWLLVGGAIHLLLTLVGGRGSANTTLKIVAWSGLPFALRDLVRAFYLLLSQKLIAAAGLSGFIDVSQGGFTLFLSSLLAMVDLYLIWNVVLLIIGIKTTSGISSQKAVISVLIPVILALSLQALLSFAVASLSNMTIMRMFF